MIDADIYCMAHRLTRAQVFAISVKNLEYKLEKEATPETNSKTVILAKYHDFFDIVEKNTWIHTLRIKNMIKKSD